MIRFFHFMVIILLLACEPATAQTRIEPPGLEVSETPSSQNDREGSQQWALNLSAPVALTAGMTMPFVKWQEIDRRVFANDADHQNFEIDRRVLVGFLHHPAEGAPEWKFDFGRQGSFASQGRFMSSVSYNLEKVVPQLRPENSDKLDSYVTATALVGRENQILVLPEFGWRWRELSSGLVIDCVLPKLLRIGYHEDDWTATVGAKQIWRIVDNDTAATGFTIRPQRLIVVEATRQLQRGFDLTFAGGGEIRETTLPYVSLAFGWSPLD